MSPESARLSLWRGEFLNQECRQLPEFKGLWPATGFLLLLFDLIVTLRTAFAVKSYLPRAGEALFGQVDAMYSSSPRDRETVAQTK